MALEAQGRPPDGTQLDGALVDEATPGAAGPAFGAMAAGPRAAVIVLQELPTCDSLKRRLKPAGVFSRLTASGERSRSLNGCGWSRLHVGPAPGLKGFPDAEAVCLPLARRLQRRLGFSRQYAQKSFLQRRLTILVNWRLGSISAATSLGTAMLRAVR
jgi:hypothetical protein